MRSCKWPQVTVSPSGPNRPLDHVWLGRNYIANTNFWRHFLCNSSSKDTIEPKCCFSFHKTVSLICTWNSWTVTASDRWPVGMDNTHCTEWVVFCTSEWSRVGLIQGGFELFCSGFFMRSLGYIPLGKYRNARTAHRSSVLPTFSEERLGIILYLVRRLPGGGARFLGAR